jgi:alpha-galactosidase
VPCRVEHAVVRPVAVGRLPVPLAALSRSFMNVVELTVQAVLWEDRDLVVQAALMDPATSAALTMAETESLVEALLRAHRDLLPVGLRR